MNKHVSREPLVKALSGHWAKHRLFFAFFPPPLVARRIARWAERFGTHAAFVDADRLHVTLDILDDFKAFPCDVAEKLFAIGASVAADPFLVEFDQVSAGGGSIALRSRLKNSAMQRLAAGIVSARIQTGLAGRVGYRFNPHLTLLYREQSPFTQTITPFAWEVRRFTLTHSLLGHTKYETLGAWEFKGANDRQYGLF